MNTHTKEVLDISIRRTHKEQ